MSRRHKPQEELAHMPAQLASQLSKAALNTAATLGRGVRRTLRGRLPRRHKIRPGERPGIDGEVLAQMPPAERVPVTCIDYGPDQMQVHAVEDLDHFFQRPRPEWVRVRWLNVDGLTDGKTLQKIAEHYKLHPLAVEDVLHVHQRPKAEEYGENGHAVNGTRRLFVVARMIQLVNSHLHSEQISIFLTHHTVITFQERKGDVWDALRQRISQPGSKLRQSDPSFLLYAMLDAVVDYCFPTLERISDELEQMEERVLTDGSRETVQDIHAIKHELMMMRREIWPLREVINTIQRMEDDLLSDTTRVYLRDVYDHTVQVIDLVETYREVATSLAEMWVSVMSNRMNEVMKVLTVIATIFIPLSFLAGVYGMNFDTLPELHWKWAYPLFWGVCLTVAGGMLYLFRRKGWL